MQKRKAGFTLIELLVVVLIIGILSVIAVPQYQKAVEKSRGTQALAVLKSLVQAQESYKMANGAWATTFDELPIELPWTGTETWAKQSITQDTRSNGEWSLQLWSDGGAAENSGIYLGRLTGKYKGAGFIYFLQNNQSLPAEEILCAERFGNGLVFAGTAGSYCTQIWKGKLVKTGTSTRQYRMP